MGYCSLQDNKITIRPKLNQASVAGAGKPTLVSRGIFQGYSLPTYASDEELFYNTMIPDRWDGTTNPKAVLYCYMDSAQDVGKKFNMQLSYQAYDGDGIVPATSNDVPVETTITTGHNSQYDSYTVIFDLDNTKINGGDLITGRLRRLAASGNEIAGEVVVSYVELEFKVNKCFGEWIY